MTTNLNLAALQSTQGISINNANSNTIGGWYPSISSAGDMNGDGYDDIIIGEPYVSGGVGIAYVVYGGSSLTNGISLTSLSISQGFLL